MDEDEAPACPTGAPAWVMTFADLMSLLMCFFVLLLSFATMDANRFKKMAESMQNAFGVQQDIPVYDELKGTSIVAQHFSPGTPDQTVTDEIRQSTQEDRPEVEIPELSLEAAEEAKRELATQIKQEVDQLAMQVEQTLAEEIDQGFISVETTEDRVIIRVKEKGSFPSGSSVLNKGFEPVMRKISEAVASTEGDVIVSGHTDNIPINTVWYRSNWELSASRAVTVAHEILKNKAVEPERLLVEGAADTKPLVPNDSAKNRAENRRVEIVIKPGTGQQNNLSESAK